MTKVANDFYESREADKNNNRKKNQNRDMEWYNPVPKIMNCFVD